MRAVSTRQRLLPARFAMTAAASVAALSILAATPALAADSSSFSWEDSRAQDIAATTVDVIFVRPLATARVILGAMIFVPSYLASLPMGQEGFDGAYDALIDQPLEYAFRREIGDMN